MLSFSFYTVLRDVDVRVDVDDYYRELATREDPGYVEFTFAVFDGEVELTDLTGSEETEIEDAVHEHVRGLERTSENEWEDEEAWAPY